MDGQHNWKEKTMAKRKDGKTKTSNEKLTYNEVIGALNRLSWEEIKEGGSQHYKRTKDCIEPIDLYRSMGTLRSFAINSIIKYAARNADPATTVSERDMYKIIHYASLLRAAETVG